MLNTECDKTDHDVCGGIYTYDLTFANVTPAKNSFCLNY